MIFLESPMTDPYFNLALEECMFEHADPKEVYFSLWQNSNTIVVGKYQNTVEEINQDYVDEHGIRVARRLSGGGAVYHDMGNLNYTFVVSRENNPDFNFKYFVLPLIETLKKFGIEAEFNGRNDVTIDGKKFCGNSQYMHHGKLLHHGCIMLDSNLENASNALKVKAAKFESKSVKSVRSRMTTINANAKEKISMEQFKKTFLECVAENHPVEQYHLTEQDLLEVQKIRDEKYAKWEWNYGKSPESNMRCEKKFESGLVSAHLNVVDAKIKNIRFYGDFFGAEDITELEKALVGCTLDHELKNILKGIRVGDYISGLTAGDLYELIMG